MTWLSDPELYLAYAWNGQLKVYRIQKKIGSPLNGNDFSPHEAYPVTDHLTLIGNSFPWKKSDYHALAAFILKYDLAVNSQGLVCPTTFPRDKPNDHRSASYFWSHDVVDLRRFGLPAVTVPFREVHYIENGGLAAVESSPKEKELTAKLTATVAERDQEREKNTSLQKQLNTEMAERQILEGLLKKANSEIEQERAERRSLEEKNSSLQKDLLNEVSQERAERRILEDTNSKLTEGLKTEGGERQTLERLLEKVNAEKAELENKNKALLKILMAGG